MEEQHDEGTDNTGQLNVLKQTSSLHSVSPVDHLLTVKPLNYSNHFWKLNVQVEKLDGRRCFLRNRHALVLFHEPLQKL